MMKNKSILLTAALVTVSVARGLTLYGAGQNSLINDGWILTVAGDTAATPVHLPHCWNADAYNTRHYIRTAGTYSRQISIPVSARGKTLYLKLDGAASKSSVEIDGSLAGTHVGAYSPHIIDITPLVEAGQTHNLSVTVDNSDRDIPPYSADFTFMGGLYRDAWLLEREPIHLDITSGPVCGFKVMASPCGDNEWRLSAGGRIINNSGRNREVEVTLTLRDASGEVVATDRKSLKASDTGATPFNLSIGKLRGMTLWSPDSPTLYTAEVTVSSGQKVTDSNKCHTAFRTVAFDDHGRFLLNGNPLKLRGMCRHQDQAPMGTGLTDEQHRRDIRLIKDMGANFIRISHYPQDDAVLEMCDRLGLLAWEEIPVIDYVPDNSRFAENAEIMVRDMIRHHYNHPSIVMWGYMNEIFLRVPANGRASAGTQAEERGVTVARTEELARRLNDAVKEEDPTRLTTMAFHASDEYNDTRLGELTDVKGWNLYNGWYGGEMHGFEKYLSNQHLNHPHHKIIVSEYGAGSDRRVHSLEPEPFDFSIEYQQKFLEHYLPVIEDSTFIAGAAHWNFIDFSSANRDESMPHINNKGLVTNDRVRKDVYHYYRAMWDDSDTVAHIAVRDWPVLTELVGSSGTVTRPVKIYTNLDRIELRVNGRSLGTRTVDNCNTIFDAVYTPGGNVLEIFAPDAPSRPLDSYTVELYAIKVEGNRANLSCGDELAINTGSNCYVRDPWSHLTWLPDAPYEPGSVYGYTSGTREASQSYIDLIGLQPLLQHNVTGLDRYTINVTPGEYEIEMSWAELSKPSAHSAYMLGANAGSQVDKITGQDIAINGITVEKGLTPYNEAGDKRRLTRRYTTTVGSDGAINIDFTPVDGTHTTSLSSVKIRKL